MKMSDLHPGKRIPHAGHEVTIARVIPQCNYGERVPSKLQFVQLVVIFDEPDAFGNLGDLLQISIEP